MEYGRNEKIKCNGDEVSEKYVWSKAYGPIDKLGGAKENWLVKRILGSIVKCVKFRGRPRIGWMDGVKKVLNERCVCGARKSDCS